MKLCNLTDEIRQKRMEFKMEIKAAVFGQTKSEERYRILLFIY